MKKILLIVRIAILLMSIGILQLNAAPAGDLQQKQITGKITDESGNPLPGVNIQVEGTTVGTISDVNGQYTISAPSQNAVLVFSFIGYNPQKITVGGQSAINVALAPSVTAMQEVVVVGYGTSRKADLTGSIAAVKQDAYVNQPVNRVDQILQGRTAGVNVMNASGAPGGATSIRIRGANSIQVATNLFMLLTDSLVQFPGC